VLIKPETLQRAGAFKFRGAYNRSVPAERRRAPARRRGLLVRQPRPGRGPGGPAAGLPGPDRHAVGLAGREGRGHRGFGAEIRFYDRFTEDRVAIADQIAAERGCVVVPSYDDPHIIAGQGTLGLEIVEQARALGVDAGQACSPVGGGGLIAGSRRR
jgi:threonine dehydratase